MFEQIKHGRGFRQFLLRGLEKVNREWLLICTGHNLLKLFRFGGAGATKAGGNAPAEETKESSPTAGITIFGRLSACMLPYQHE